MNKKEIIEQLSELTKQDTVLSVSDRFKELTDAFYQILKEQDHQWEIEKLNRIEKGEKPESIEKPIDEDFEYFKKLVSEFKEKRKKEIDAIKAEQEANYKAKKSLIHQLKDLIENEEHIGKAIGKVKEIREKWSQIGDIARNKQQELQKEYGHLMDDFNYNIKIYKEIADHDKTKNLQLKKEIIDDLKKLLKEDKIKTVETKLRTLQNKWSEIGGTFQEEWDKIKEEYYNTVNSIYEKIKHFYENRKEEQVQNIEKKKTLIEEAKKLNEIDNKEHKTFQKTTEKFKELQNEWKKIGFGPKEENEKAWQEFRQEFDRFFDKKKAFYEDRNKVFDKVKAKKEELIKQVEILKDSTDWKNTISKIKDIQNKWKTLGSAGPKHENKLWKKFREPIDHFFNAKDYYFNQLDENNAENLNAKKALIEEIKNYKVTKDIKKTIEELKAFAEKFKTIGHVPFAQKDAIYQDFKNSLDEKYNEIDIDKAEKEKILFQAKIDNLLSGPQPEHALNHEKNIIKQNIEKLEKEKNQLDNNLGFFASSSDNNPLLKSAKKSISEISKKIDKFKNQLKQINIVERALSQPEKETIKIKSEDE